MAKKSYIPKRIAGYKIPKSVRKSRTLSSLLSSQVGREILAGSLTAGAAAVAAALAQPREAFGKGGKKRSVVGLVSDAIGDGAHAAMGVIADAARSARETSEGGAGRGGQKRRH